MRRIVIPVAATALTVAAMWFQALVPNPTLAEAPAVSLGEIPGFESREFEPSEAELSVLPADTKFVKRVYTNAYGQWFQVSVVIGGRYKSSIHRPELCLPSQGFQMRSPRNLDAGGTGWRALTLERRGEQPIGFAYTFFNQTGYRTTSHMARIFRDVWDRSVLNRLDRWVMVTVNCWTADDGRMAEFLGLLKGGLQCSK